MIHRSNVLKEWDVREDSKMNRVVFSVRFITKDGRFKFFPRAISMPVRGNMGKLRLRGCMPIDKNGNKIGHITPVNIDLITEFNNEIVWY